jgi:hypothetical protein
MAISKNGTILVPSADTCKIHLLHNHWEGAIHKQVPSTALMPRTRKQGIVRMSCEGILSDNLEQRKQGPWGEMDYEKVEEGIGGSKMGNLEEVASNEC